MRVTDLASALYLGLTHGSASLRPWDQLTSGAPAAVTPPPGADRLVRRLAMRMGTEAATLGTSTLHLFLDLFSQLEQHRFRILADAALYPIGRWGVERARSAGLHVDWFPHHDLNALASLLGRPPYLHPVVVTDGLCSGCGSLAPLEVYTDLVRQRHGWVVLDDSQALGLLGSCPTRFMPYGRDGGGSARYIGIDTSAMVIIASLAKAWGSPLAVLAGSRRVVKAFERQSATRLYCSPPAVASIHAAEHALDVEASQGRLRRARLSRNVEQLRRQTHALGLTVSTGLLPMQSLGPLDDDAAVAAHRRLWHAGVRCFLSSPACRPGPALTCIVRADHAPQDLRRAGLEIVKALWSARREIGSHPAAERTSSVRRLVR